MNWIARGRAMPHLRLEDPTRPQVSGQTHLALNSPHPQAIDHQRRAALQ
jgi:hypothetical protein